MADDQSFSFESGHKDLIHDVQIDFYGKTLASASSDRCIRIYEIISNKHRLIGELRGHTGPIWKLSWAHPKYGCILASCGYDKRVIMWIYNKANNKWNQLLNDNKFTSSVNCVQFAPSTVNNNLLQLIAGCSDGSIAIYTQQSHSNHKFSKKVIVAAHDGGVNAVSWSTPSTIIDNNGINQESIRFVSGGCDNMIKIWNMEYKSNEYKCGALLNSHTNWIRDVSWSPIPGSNANNIIASCSEDKSVIIWKEQNKKWIISEKLKFNDKVWSVSWSELGNILAIAAGHDTVQLYKEGNDGKWQNVTKIN